MTESKPARSHLPFLDGLRGLAFLMVYMNHNGKFVLTEPMSPLMQTLLGAYNWWANMSWIGVDLFFCLSAYLVTSQLLNEEYSTGGFRWGAFQFRRILRIWPMYFLVLAFGTLEMIFWLRPEQTPGLAYYSTFALYMLTFTGNLAIATNRLGLTNTLAPTWTVCIEQQFYLVWASILKVLHNNRIRCLFLGAALLGTILFRAHLIGIAQERYSFYLHSLARLDSFVLGAAIAFAFQKYPSTPHAKGWILLLASLLCFVATNLIYPDLVNNWHTLSYTGLSVSCSFLLLASFKCTIFQKVLTFKPLMKVGQLSYGMYLMHTVCISMIYPWLLPSFLNSIKMLPLFGLCALPVLFGIAWLLYRFIERPILSLKHRPWKLQTTPVADFAGTEGAHR